MLLTFTPLIQVSGVYCVCELPPVVCSVFSKGSQRTKRRNRTNFPNFPLFSIQVWTRPTLWYQADATQISQSNHPDTNWFTHYPKPSKELRMGHGVVLAMFTLPFRYIFTLTMKFICELDVKASYPFVTKQLIDPLPCLTARWEFRIFHAKWWFCKM